MARFNIIIPAAGVGTRLRPHTNTVPKALLPVAGQPILGHILDRLSGLKDVGTIYIVIGFLGEQIEQYVADHYDLPVRFVTQKELLGLGYAVYLALSEMPGDEPILVILGDTIVDTDLQAFTTSPEDLIGVKAVDDPRRFGVVETDGEYIRRIVEKPTNPPSNLAVVGLYAIRSTALLRQCLIDAVDSAKTRDGEIQMTDALDAMIRRGSRMRAVTVDGWFDCGKVETMLETNRYLLAKRGMHYELPDSLLTPPVYIAPSARVTRSIVGPYVSIGERVQMADVIIQNAIVGDGASVSRSIIKDSLIGAGAVVEGVAKCLNIGGAEPMERETGR